MQSQIVAYPDYEDFWHFATRHIVCLNTPSKRCVENRRQIHQQTFVGTACRRAVRIGLPHKINRPECSADTRTLGRVRKRHGGCPQASLTAALQLLNFSPLGNYEKADVFFAGSIAPRTLLAAALVPFPCRVLRAPAVSAAEAFRDFRPELLRVFSHRVVFRNG